ncbi:MAG: chemotaxis protein CheA [Spirochaetales bacterium]|nr:chemotaxis protein CheA [Spirochaetales bacterium]
MNDALHDIYIQEAEDNLQILESAIISIEENPDDKDTINEAFRAIHSIKGGAGLAGFSGIKDFTHIIEDLFEHIRSGVLRVQENHISVILDSLDIIKMMIKNIKTNQDSNTGIDTEDIISQIKKMISRIDGAEIGGNEFEKKDETGISKRNFFHLNLKYYSEVFNSGIDPLMFISDLEKAGKILFIHTDTHEFPEISEFNPELFYLSWRLFFETEISEKDIYDIFCFVIDESEITITNMNSIIDNPDALAEFAIEGKTLSDFIISEKEAEPASSNKPTEHEKREEHRKVEDRRKIDRRESDPGAVSYIRVQTEKLENIFNSVSELLILQARLNMLTEEYSEDIPDGFDAVADSLKNITTIIQEQVTSLRMMSLSSTFDRFKRVVRDIATEQGKKVILFIEGQDTELDKNMIEKLNDPLKHLVRNCIDHGIETADERMRKGKKPEGQLRLSASIESGQVLIEIADDGAGINKEKILQKAIERKLVSKEQNLSEGEILSLIFHPGLSTAEKVTDLSGRGVGMDVVKSTITELHGNIDIFSEDNKGTTFRLHLPLTLAILDGMLVSVGNEKYILPTLSILEIFRPLAEHLKTISAKGEVVFFRGDYIPIIRLHALFNIDNAIAEPSDAQLIVVYSGGMKAAILVDTVLEQFQIVLKSLQRNFHKVENISSATILGNGDVALILDIQNLFQNLVKTNNV